MTPFYELRELFTKNTGAEKQERRVFFTQLRKKLCRGIAAIPVGRNIIETEYKQIITIQR